MDLLTVGTLALYVPLGCQNSNYFRTGSENVDLFFGSKSNVIWQFFLLPVKISQNMLTCTPMFL